jgi:hypothetical protein
MYHHLNALIVIICYGVIIYGIIEKDPTKKLILLLVGVISTFVYPIIMEILLNIKAILFKCGENIEKHTLKHNEIYKNKIPIAYSDDYNITACGIEKCHPFDSCKYGRGNFKHKIFGILNYEIFSKYSI